MTSKRRTQAGDGNQGNIQITTNEQTFHLLFENHPIPMLVYDLITLEFLQVNEAAVETYGYSREEFKELNLKDIISEAGVKRLLKEMKKKQPGLQHSEWHNHLKDGHIIDVEVTSHILDYEGRKSVLVMVQDITERKKAENALRISEEKFRKAFMISPDAININRMSDGMYVAINKGFTQIMGYKESESIGRTSLELNIWDDPNDRTALVAVLEKTGEVSNLEACFRAKSGDIKYGMISASVLELGGVKHIISITRDITPRKQSDERYHTLFDRMMDGIYRSTHEGRFIDVNPAMVKMFGYSSREEMLAVDIKSELYFAPEERGSHILDTGQEETEEYRMRRKDGSEIWVEDHGYYVHDEHGNPKFHEGMLRDITARKHAEEALSKLKKAVDTSTDAIFMTDIQGIFTYINPGFTAMYGFTTEEVVGKATPRILKCGLLDPQYYVDFWQKLSNKQEVKDEVLNKRKDGKLIDADQSATPILDDAGHIIGYLAIQRDITKRKQMDDELRWAEERYRKLFEEAPMMEVITRRQSGEPIITDCNHTFLKTMGFTREDVIGRPLADFYTPSSRLALLGKDGYMRALNGKLLSDERELIARDRHIINAMLTATPEVNARGQVIGTHAIYVDMTERKMAEEALQTAEANYRSIFENATVGIYQSTHDGHFLNVNKVMARIFGYDSPREMIESIVNIDEQYYVNPATRQEFIRLMVEQGQVHEFNSLNYRRDGSHFHIQESARAVKDAQGNILYYEGFVSDVTERKHSEESLRESENRFRHMADTTPALVWMSGVDALYNYFNKPWLSFTGRTMEQEMGNGWTEGVHPEDYEHCLETYTTSFNAHSEFKMEYRLRRADGEYRWMLNQGVPRFSAEGDFFGFIGSCIDVSDFKKAEDELSRANDSLTIAHRELEKSLSHEQLLARTDGLTGLYNYRYFFELATREFEASMRYQRSLAVIIFDMDHLKQVNDTLGHLYGDRMLTTVAQTAITQVRNVDSLARYGGDEFVILLPQTSAQTAFAIAERIRASVASIRLTTEKGTLFVTLSIGIAEMQNDPPDQSVEQVVQRADQALYTAKQAGRNRTVIFKS